MMNVGEDRMWKWGGRRARDEGQVVEEGLKLFRILTIFFPGPQSDIHRTSPCVIVAE